MMTTTFIKYPRHSANEQLLSFLEEVDDGMLLVVLQMLDTATHPVFRRNVIKPAIANGLPGAGTSQRKILARQIALHLRYMGSHDLMCGMRLLRGKEAQTNYMNVVHDCAKQLNRQIKKRKLELPKAGGLETYEEIICEQLLQISFQDKSEEEIAAVLQDAGLEKSSAASMAKKTALGGAPGAGILLLCKLLSKKQIYELMKEVIKHLIHKIVGKEAAEKLIAALLKKVTQRKLVLILRTAGWAWMAADAAHFMCSPAQRVTIPCVSLISALRYQQRQLPESETAEGMAA